MNINAPTFTPQGASNKSNQASSTTASRSQRQSGRAYLQSQTSIQPDAKGSSSRSQNIYPQGDQNAHGSVPSNKRNNSSHRKHKQLHDHHQRNQSKSNGRKNEFDSLTDFSLDQVQDTTTVSDATLALSNVSLYDLDPAFYGSTNKRGQISLNHLLNFTFPPRQQTFNNISRRQRSANYQPYNKERFVNANFRFLINSNGDYTVYQVDPDLLLNWKDIEQVVITTPTIPQCPICLQKPTAARVTKCGHTYCLACIIHYLHLENESDKPKKWRKCPICWDAVYQRDLKSVRFWMVQNIGQTGDGGVPKEDEMIAMRLIQRAANSTMALPRSSTWPLSDEHSVNPSPPWHFAPDALSFSKLILASNDYLKGEYSRDLEELENSLKEAQFWSYHEEIPFIEMAIVSTEGELDALEKRLTAEVAAAEKRAQDIILRAETIRLIENKGMMNKNDPLFDHDVESNDSQNETSGSFESGTSPPPFLPQDFIEQPHIAPYLRVQTKSTSDQISKADELPSSLLQRSNNGAYLFFQSEDGQRIYLHPLDIRVLKHEFGSYENFPNEISVRVIGVEESTMTEELRKRCKYLGHLPLSCDVTFLEVDLKGVVSESTLQTFANELRQRQNRRAARQHKEELQHQRATQQECDLPDDNNDQFFQTPLSHGESSPGQESMVADDIHLIGSVINEEHGQHIAEYSGPKTVWGTPAVSFARVTTTSESTKNQDDMLDDDDDWGFHEEEIYVGKKQKKKKLVLMSTGNRRHW